MANFMNKRGGCDDFSSFIKYTDDYQGVCYMLSYVRFVECQQQFLWRRAYAWEGVILDFNNIFLSADINYIVIFNSFINLNKYVIPNAFVPLYAISIHVCSLRIPNEIPP